MYSTMNRARTLPLFSSPSVPQCRSCLQVCLAAPTIRCACRCAGSHVPMQWPSNPCALLYFALAVLHARCCRVTGRACLHCRPANLRPSTHAADHSTYTARWPLVEHGAHMLSQAEMQMVTVVRVLCRTFTMWSHRTSVWSTRPSVFVLTLSSGKRWRCCVCTSLAMTLSPQSIAC